MKLSSIIKRDRSVSKVTSYYVNMRCLIPDFEACPISEMIVSDSRFLLIILYVVSPCVGSKRPSFGMVTPMQQMQWFRVHVAMTLIVFLLEAKITSILRIFQYFECRDRRIRCPAIRYVFSFVSASIKKFWFYVGLFTQNFT